jgi:hypothetical protein
MFVWDGASPNRISDGPFVIRSIISEFFEKYEPTGWKLVLDPVL